MRIIFLLLLFLPFLLWAEDMNGYVNEPISIHIDAPAPKAGGGDFYLVRVYPEGKYNVHESIPETQITFDAEGDYSLEVVLMHAVKTTCASVHMDEISRRVIRFHILGSK